MKLLPTDGNRYDWFGERVDLRGNILAVGAIYDDDQADDAGAVYLYESTTGNFITKLTADDGDPSDSFGRAVAIGNDLVAIGSSYDDDAGDDAGAVYLFNTTTGAQLRKLLPETGADNDQFGQRIDVRDNLIAVGVGRDDDLGNDAGAVYLIDAQSGETLYKLTADDGKTLDYFGTSVALGNGFVAAGSPYNDGNEDNSGAVYIFDSATGDQLLKLAQPSPQIDDRFGTSICIDNGYLAVGATGGTSSPNGAYRGAVHLYDSDSFQFLRTFRPNDNHLSNAFGVVDLDESSGHLVVSAAGDDSLADNAGAAYLFDLNTGEQLAKLYPSDASPAAFFGRSIAIDNGRIAVGVGQDDDLGMGVGAVYLFDIPDSFCVGDTNHDGTLSADDFTDWLTAYTEGSPECDQNSDGRCTPTDFSAWIANFNTGC
ncbi:MAG: hypothetical protein Phyf2KO_17160 [Phycisphaerales bacterium]